MAMADRSRLFHRLCLHAGVAGNRVRRFPLRPLTHLEATMTDSGGHSIPRMAAEGEEPLLGAYLPFEVTTLSAEQVARMPVKAPGPVTLQDRQGVFVHSFKCSICDLEFVVFSWRADRHRVGSTFCPECGVRSPMIHWRVQTSKSLEFCSDGPGREIYQMFSPSDAALMHDSALPSQDRYDPSEEPATHQREKGCRCCQGELVEERDMKMDRG